MKIDDHDWLVIEVYMSDFHPDSRWVILESMRRDHVKIIEISEQIATEMIAAACAEWGHHKYNNNCDIIAYRVIENDGREG